MIVYSVTVAIDPGREAEWVSWMREEHLPAVMATGFFTHYRFVRLLSDDDPAQGITYNVQYLLPSMAHYEAYQREQAPALQAETQARFAGSFAAFRTLLEVVEQNSYLDYAKS